jgi:hypothetical protein
MTEGHWLTAALGVNFLARDRQLLTRIAPAESGRSPSPAYLRHRVIPSLLPSISLSAFSSFQMLASS